MHDIPETDWKLLREVHVKALERYCERVLGECRSILEKGTSAHDRYVELYRMLEEREDDLGQAFNDMRRSRALLRLLWLRRLGVVTDEEMARFTEETRRAVEAGLAL